MSSGRPRALVNSTREKLVRDSIFKEHSGLNCELDVRQSYYDIKSVVFLSSSALCTKLYATMLAKLTPFDSVLFSA